jgi:hypothetical protein
MFTTPKLLESLALELEKRGTTIPHKWASRGFSLGGTEFTRSGLASRSRSCSTSVHDSHYGNTLMGLACSRPVTPRGWLHNRLLCAPAPRGDRGHGPQGIRASRAPRGHGTRAPHHADERILRPGLPRARRGRARAARRHSIPGTGSAESGLSAMLRAARSWACTEAFLASFLKPKETLDVLNIPICAGARPTRASSKTRSTTS